MTVKYLNYSGTDFCPLKPEIAWFSIGFRLNIFSYYIFKLTRGRGGSFAHPSAKTIETESPVWNIHVQYCPLDSIRENNFPFNDLTVQMGYFIHDLTRRVTDQKVVSESLVMVSIFNKCICLKESNENIEGIRKQ